ncbi:MAG: Lhr family helicase, partial [Gammaproteobacteria bacterium]
RIITRELTTPSPMALEIINARPYAFLDDVPAEERRTLAIQQRRFNSPAEAGEIGRLNREAIERVRLEAWPFARDEDELHDALTILGFLTEQEGKHGPLVTSDKELSSNWPHLFENLQKDQRATDLVTVDAQHLWVAAERLHEMQVLYPGAIISPVISAVAETAGLTPESVLQELLRSRLEGLGPVTARQLAQPLSTAVPKIEQALMALEQQGIVLQGRFTPGCTDTEWCERGLLARIHRYTLKQLRSEIEPVSPSEFMRFLFRWHGLHEPVAGEAALTKVLKQLEGVNLPAACWESEILSRRVKPYFVSELDQLCNSGKFLWLRLKPPGAGTKKTAGKKTAVALIERCHLSHWREFSPLPSVESLALSANALKVFALLKKWGASFFQELMTETGLLKTQLEEVLGELVASGLITSDSYQGLRTLVTPEQTLHKRSRRYPGHHPFAAAGRWSLLRPQHPASDNYQAVEYIARILLLRYGVVFRKILANEEGIPTWRELLYSYRRLEARGEIRGGRFVQGFAGEQFALPEAVTDLRNIHKQPKSAELTVINSTDPLNLTGIITPGDRIASIASHRVIYRDGTPIAYGTGSNIHYLDEMDSEHQWQLRWTLMRK